MSLMRISPATTITIGSSAPHGILMPKKARRWNSVSTLPLSRVLTINPVRPVLMISSALLSAKTPAKHGMLPMLPFGAMTGTDNIVSITIFVGVNHNLFP